MNGAVQIRGRECGRIVCKITSAILSEAVIELSDQKQIREGLGLFQLTGYCSWWKKVRIGIQAET